MHALTKQHTEADRAHAEIDTLGQAWLTAGSLTPAQAARFSALVTGLTDLYREHISIEEDELFPAAAAALGKATCKAMGAEMAARRHVEYR
jgi:hypothetical protein